MKDTIKALQAYASWHIAKLSQVDDALLPLAQLVTERFGATKSNELPSQVEAEEYIAIPLMPQDFPGDNFDTQMLKDCYDIAIKTIEIAARPDSTNEHMVKVARYLHPLLSLDDSTIMVGRDLEEYIDWYFADDIQAREKQEYLKKMINDWEYLRIKVYT